MEHNLKSQAIWRDGQWSTCVHTAYVTCAAMTVADHTIRNTYVSVLGRSSACTASLLPTP